MLEDVADRGRFPAQRRRRRTKAEIEAARAVSTDSSRVEMARDDAVAGLTKLQQAKASENSQGETSAVNSAEKVQAGRPTTKIVPPEAPGPGPQSGSTATKKTQEQATKAKAPLIPPAPSTSSNSTPGQHAPTAVDVAMKDAMRAFHYPVSQSANHPVRPFRPYSYSPRTVETASKLQPGLQEIQAHVQAHNNTTLSQQGSQPPLSAHPANPNLAHLSYSSPYDPNARPVYDPYPSSSSTAGISNQSPARTTVWPEKSRSAIAAAARDSLMSNPKNAGKTITKEDVMNILNTEPSYVELCDMLERKWGFVFDRRQFAHSLLQAVPPTKTAPNGVNGAAPNRATSSQQQQVAPTPVMASAAESTNAKRGSIAKGKQKQTLLNSSPTTQQPKEPTPTAEPQPTTKAAMARKRTFNDLVDLTADSDDEERTKKLKLAEVSNGAATSDSSRDPFRVGNEPNDGRSHPLLPTLAPKPKEKEGFDMSNLKNFTLSAAREALRTAEIAQPIDKRKARPLPVYNVKTLARDILITAGKYETEAPLNFHLFGLKDIYKHVNNTTDLSTLRWDIMDPGGPAPGTGLEGLGNGEDGGQNDGLGEELDEELGTRSSHKGKEKARQSEATVDTNGEETEDDPAVPPTFELGTKDVSLHYY